MRLFGTDGVRGVANQTLTAEMALALGRATGSTLARERGAPRMLIGRDTRASGEMLECALSAGLCASGWDVTSLGVATTPAVAWLTNHHGFDAGAVISASHNPAHENGIKLLSPNGAKLPDDIEDAIEQKMLSISRGPLMAEDSGASVTPVGRLNRDADLLNAYVEHAVETLPAAPPPIRIVVDAAHGAGSELNVAALSRIGLDLRVLHSEPDGWNINDRCGSTHPEMMRRAVVEHGAALGAAFDGDGDRVILADETGAIVDGDHMMALFAHHWANSPELPHNTVVGTVMSNIGLEESLASIGVRLARAPVGDRYVAEVMRETGAAVGGEKSGHLILSHFGQTGDGLVTLLQVIRVMVETGRSLGELASVMREYPQVLIGVPVRRKQGWDSHPGVAAALAEAERVLEGRGRLLVRPSGTENLIRIMAEGPDMDEITGVVNAIAEAIRQHHTGEEPAAA